MRFPVYTVIPALLLALSSNSFADDDVLIIDNGDRLTGELKSLERGRLRFDTSATGTIPIEWDEVALLTSYQNIQVETESGDRYLGKLVSQSHRGHIVVETGDGPVDLAMDKVVSMIPIEERGIDRIDASVTAGFNIAKASDVRQAQLGFDLAARSELRVLGLEVDSVTSDSQDNESSQRHSLDLTYRRLWADRWVSGGLLRLERNDELGLDLRTSLGVGGGRSLLRTNSAVVWLTGGVQLSRENVSGSLPDEDTVEAFAALEWDWFRYDTPELDLSSNLQVIPNLTDTGRVRAELDVSLTWEMIVDLFWRVEFYRSYDSDPVADGAAGNDYGIITSLGWSF